MTTTKGGPQHKTAYEGRADCLWLTVGPYFKDFVTLIFAVGALICVSLLLYAVK